MLRRALTRPIPTIHVLARPACKPGVRSYSLAGESIGDVMEGLETAANAAAPVAHALELERQLRLVEQHYVEARHAAEQAREELRALMIRAVARPAAIVATRAKLQAVAARCSRLLEVIEDLEERIEAC